jgi:DNA-binding Lrp family transcriptional regulator
MKRQWQNPEFATKSASASSERITRLNANPQFQTAAIEAKKQLKAAAIHREEVRARIKRLEAAGLIKQLSPS